MLRAPFGAPIARARGPGEEVCKLWVLKGNLATLDVVFLRYTPLILKGREQTFSVLATIGAVRRTYGTYETHRGNMGYFRVT